MVLPLKLSEHSIFLMILLFFFIGNKVKFIKRREEKVYKTQYKRPILLVPKAAQKQNYIYDKHNFTE